MRIGKQMGSASEVLTGSSAPPSIWGRGRAAQPACFCAALIALISSPSAYCSAVKRCNETLPAIVVAITLTLSFFRSKQANERGLVGESRVESLLFRWSYKQRAEEFFESQRGHAGCTLYKLLFCQRHQGTR